MADIVTQTIKQMEGFRSDAYWDENAWRVGYGSDTYTDDNGKVHKVLKSTSGITREQAEADLARRIPEFQQSGIIKYVGQRAWDNLTPHQQAAVTSVAYNYGSLAKLPSLKQAVQSGSSTQLTAAIEARARDNGGINKSRRLFEAELAATPYSPNVPPRPMRDPVSGTAMAAIDTMLGVPPTQASAYAPAGSPLQAPPAVPRLPADMRLGLPPGGFPRARDTISGRGGTDSFNSGPMRDMLPPARLEGSGGSDMLASGSGQDRLPPRPPNLYDAMQDYAKTYTPTAQRPRVTAEGLNVNVRPTVRIDPATGYPSGGQPNLQASLENSSSMALAREKARMRQPHGVDPSLMAPTLPTGFSLPVPDQRREGMIGAQPMDTSGQSFRPRYEEAVAIPRNPTVAALPPPPVPTIVARDETYPVDPRFDRPPGAMPGAPRPTMQPPSGVMKTAGVTGMEALPPGYRPDIMGPPRNSPLIDMPLPPPAPLDPRIAPGAIRPGAIGGAIPGAYPGAIPRVNGTAMANLPQIPVPQQQIMPPMPHQQHPNPQIPAMPQNGYAGLPPSEIPNFGFRNPPDLMQMLTGKDAQRVGAINRGERPILRGLMQMIMGNGQQVATKRDTRRPTYSTPAGQALLEWANGGSALSASSDAPAYEMPALRKPR